MVEKFDFDDYNKRLAESPSGDRFTRADGTRIELFSGKNKSVIHEKPEDQFYFINKEFYANGILKLKGKYFGGQVKIGMWQYFDDRGKLIEEKNEDNKFGKVKPQDILTFLEKEHWIDQHTGKGRDAFTLNFTVKDSILLNEPSRKVWYIIIENGARFEGTPRNDIGEPKAFRPIIYEIDGDTGEVLKKYTGE